MIQFKTVTIQHGSKFEVYQEQDLSIHESLPVGTYIVKFDKIKDTFYLELIDNFKLPAKIYGPDHNRNAQRVITTFGSRSLSTGVLLSGVKGSGKTLLAKQISVLGAEQGYPTVVISNDWCGNEFNAFIQSINCPAIVLFDEFEKTYGWSDQPKLLTLLDGVFPTKKLFILTTNHMNDVSQFLQNRPSRIYYSIDFSVLTTDFVREYCEDVLKNQDHMASIINYVKVFPYFNFDMLASVVEEMNRYGESFENVIGLMNIEPEIDREDTYEISGSFRDHSWVINPSYKRFNPNDFTYDLELDEAPKAIRSDPTLKAFFDVGDRSYVEFDNTSLKSFDPTEEQFVYTVEHQRESLSLIVKRKASAIPWYGKYNPALM